MNLLLRRTLVHLILYSAKPTTFHNNYIFTFRVFTFSNFHHQSVKSYMKRLVGLLILCTCITGYGKAQQVQSIAFHLYTDSLKKGVYNYINVDGQLIDGNWRPLNSKLVQFTANTGTWDGNNLIIDSAYNKDSVVVTAVLRNNPALKKTVTIYMKKNLTDERLKTEEQILNEMNSTGSGRKRRKG